MANVEEEAHGIDGFIGEQPLQIKSITYKFEARLSEKIDVPIVYYEKKNDYFCIDFGNTALLCFLLKGPKSRD